VPFVSPRRALVLGCAVAAAAAAGCGRKAAPQPPIIRVAERTRDLNVAQVGTAAVLSWSYPSMTRAGGPLPDLESVEVWRLSLAPAQEPGGGTSARQRRVREQLLLAKGHRLAQLSRDALRAATSGSKLVYRDDLGAWYRENRERLPLVIWYAVRSICCGGRVSELSNIVRLEPNVPPAPPTQVAGTPAADGITLRWLPADGLPVVIERSADGKRWRRITAEPVPAGPWRDVSAVQGGTWLYRLRSVKKVGGTTVLGDPSPPLAVAYPDVYPPSPPGSFVCLPETGRVRLRWAKVGDAVEYRVFRRRKRGGWDHLDFHVKGEEYTDAEPPAGKVTYAVRSVDRAGNESEPVTCETIAGGGP